MLALPSNAYGLAEEAELWIGDAPMAADASAPPPGSTRCNLVSLQPGTELTVDCDDTDGAIKPGAVEIVGDEVDQNCDNIEECWLDSDNDVDRSNSATKLSTTDLDCTDFQEALDSDPIDCNDNDNAINSGATELAGDEIDQNCDNLEICFADADEDGYRHETNTVGPTANLACTGVGQALASVTVDCDDTDNAVNGGGAEIVADGLDQNCDGVDDCYRDNDDDNYGSNSVFTSDNISCVVATLASNNSNDCNDTQGTVYPGANEIVADGLDQDCDNVDHCYDDSDFDGVGGSSSSAGNDLDCTDSGESTLNNDCDDGDVNSFPGASVSSIWVADGADRDCDGFEECFQNIDLDNFGSSTIIDDNGDGLCQAASGEASVSGDCDDNVATVYPGALEVVADNTDQDCDDFDDCYHDSDFDGYGSGVIISGTTINCTAADESRVPTDCDDSDNERFVGNTVSFQLQRYEQPATSDVGNTSMVDTVQVMQKLRTNFFGISHKIVLLDYIQSSCGGGTAYWVSAKCVEIPKSV